jgi:hypothetical protein
MSNSTETASANTNKSSSSVSYERVSTSNRDLERANIELSYARWQGFMKSETAIWVRNLFKSARDGGLGVPNDAENTISMLEAAWKTKLASLER